jgi:hypothetical protein
MGLATGGAGMFAIGILNDSHSSGTGLFATLWLLSSHGLDYRRPIAYTLVIGDLFWNSVSALTLGIVAQTKWTWLPALVSGSLIGDYFGALLVIT